MRVLVTGGTGFVGSHLVEALVQRGDQVTALIRSPHKAGRLRELGVNMVPGDLDDLAALDRAAQGQEVVCHVAGVVAARNEAAFLRANREGTRHLLEAAARHGRPRFVLVSSMAAAGPAARGRPLQGSEPARPVTQYGRSKLAAEEVVRRGPLPWIILRPPMVYGPRDTEVLKLFRLARSGLAPVFGRGTQELSAVYGPDLAEALIAAATATTTGEGGAPVGRVYYPCHREIFTSAEFARAVGLAMNRRVRVIRVPLLAGRAALAITGAVAGLLGQATILTTDKANEFFQEAWTGNPAPLERDTGWCAAHDLAAGLAETYRWYRGERWL